MPCLLLNADDKFVALPYSGGSLEDHIGSGIIVPQPIAKILGDRVYTMNYIIRDCVTGAVKLLISVLGNFDLTRVFPSIEDLEGYLACEVMLL